MFRVVLDTCVLFKPLLCDTVLSIAEEGELIVTENVRGFPTESTKPYEIDVVSQDEFLLDQFDLLFAGVCNALQRQVSRDRSEDERAELVVSGEGR